MDASAPSQVICSRCKSHVATRGYSCCSGCRAKMRAYQRARRPVADRGRTRVLCTRCRAEMSTPGYKRCYACRVQARRYHRHPDPPRISIRDKARAWLAVAPRTPSQLAELLGISRAHAATLLCRLRQERGA